VQVSITELKKVTGSKKDFAFDGPLELDEFELSGPVQVRLRLANAGSRLLVCGSLRSQVRLECSRCVEEFDFSLVADIDEEYLPEDSPEIGEDRNPLYSDVNVYGEDDSTIDVLEVLRQNTIAALPIQPLCREDCRGLCANCGENRNVRDCGCQTQEIDSRWARLLEIQARHQPSNAVR